MGYHTKTKEAGIRKNSKRKDSFRFVDSTDIREMSSSSRGQRVASPKKYSTELSFTPRSQTNSFKVTESSFTSDKSKQDQTDDSYAYKFRTTRTDRNSQSKSLRASQISLDQYNMKYGFDTNKELDCVLHAADSRKSKVDSPELSNQVQYELISYVNDLGRPQKVVTRSIVELSTRNNCYDRSPKELFKKQETRSPTNTVTMETKTETKRVSKITELNLIDYDENKINSHYLINDDPTLFFGHDYKRDDKDQNKLNASSASLNNSNEDEIQYLFLSDQDQYNRYLRQSYLKPDSEIPENVRSSKFLLYSPTYFAGYSKDTDSSYIQRSSQLRSSEITSQERKKSYERNRLSRLAFDKEIYDKLENFGRLHSIVRSENKVSKTSRITETMRPMTETDVFYSTLRTDLKPSDSDMFDKTQFEGDSTMKRSYRHPCTYTEDHKYPGSIPMYDEYIHLPPNTDVVSRRVTEVSKGRCLYHSPITYINIDNSKNTHNNETSSSIETARTTNNNVNSVVVNNSIDSKRSTDNTTYTVTETQKEQTNGGYIVTEYTYETITHTNQS